MGKVDDHDHTQCVGQYIFGLSIERPILDHHPKAHIHDIRRISPWNPVDFTMKSSNFMKSVKSGGFQVKSSRFHPEIQQISWNPWNLVDFTHEIWQFHPWNLADFTLKSSRVHPDFSCEIHSSKLMNAGVGAKTLHPWWIQGGGFHPWNPGGFHPEIWWISPWNLVDFTCEIWQISPRFHLWNPPKIIKEVFQQKLFSLMNAEWGLWPRISPMKSGRFHPDFTCEIHPNYKSKCFSKNSSVWLMQGRGYDQGFHEIHWISPWNLADLTCEIQWISPRYHL